jgi:hypothetical protein
MKLRKSLLIGLCVASLGGISAPLLANAEVGIFLNIPPPELRVEPIPVPRAGFIWTPGYWDVNHGRHEWRAGHWEHERHGYHYAAPGWVQHDNRWELRRGHWDRD